MPIAKEFTSIYEIDYTIHFGDCDASGVLTISKLCQIIQRAATRHSVLGGISFLDLQKVDQAWVLSKMRLELTALPLWQDVIHIKTWIEKLEGVRSVRNFEVRLNQQKIAGISSLWGLINTQTRRPEPMRLEHDHFLKFQEQYAIASPFEKTPRQLDFQKLQEDRVRYSDLDMVQHVTNTQYISWIIDALYANNQPVHKLQAVDMHFKKEMGLQDSYTILQAIAGTKHYFDIRNQNDESTFSCILEGV